MARFLLATRNSLFWWHLSQKEIQAFRFLAKLTQNLTLMRTPSQSVSPIYRIHGWKICYVGSPIQHGLYKYSDRLQKVILDFCVLLYWNRSHHLSTLPYRAYVIIFVSAKFSEAGGVLQINYLRVISHFWSVHTFFCIKTVKVCGEIYSSLEFESKLLHIWQT